MPRKSAKFYLTNYFAKWNWLEVLLLGLSVIIPLVIGIIFNSHMLEIILSIIMPVSSILAAKGRIESRFLALAIGVLYIVVTYWASLYGEVIIVALVFMPIKAYGLLNWLRNRSKKSGSENIIVISKTGGREVVIVLVVHALLAVGLYFLLDAFNTAFLVVSTLSATINAMGTWFLARRSVLAFPVYLILDFVQLALWLLVVLGGDTNAMVLVSSMAIFAVVDTYGWIAWSRLRKRQMEGQVAA